MMLVLSMLILATLVLSFYSVDQVTASVAQTLSGPGLLVVLLAVVALAGWLIWKKRRSAAQTATSVPRKS